MEVTQFSGSADITDGGIKKHFKGTEPWEPIAELIWNGFDAGATIVRVFVRERELGGVESATVLDNGKGINFLNTGENFGKFNESLKKDNFSQHGAHGRGRLAFHRICSKATWYTIFESQNATITIHADSIKNFSGSLIKDTEQNPLLLEQKSGTCVELVNFNKNIPEEEEMIALLTRAFGWILALRPELKLTYNSRDIVPPKHDSSKKTFNIKNSEFHATALRWHEKPAKEKSHTYLIGSHGNIVYRELSSLNNKPDFYTSVFVSSDWANGFIQNDNELSFDPEEISENQTWRAFTKELNVFTQSIYDDFLSKHADEQIEKFVEDGAFPDYSNINPSYSDWRLKNTKSIVKSILIHDPSVIKSLNKKQRKILIRLLDKLSVSNENDSLLEVLDSVLELDSKTMQTFAEQLKKSKLDNIIQTIEILQKRDSVIQRISKIMDEHYKEVLETPDLQGIIESNTWLFGNQYETIGAEEDTFTKIAKNLRATVPGINNISEEDIADGATIDGANRQVDLFLVRRSLCLDSLNRQYYRCVIIEIKRPSVALSKTHFRQVEDYADILNKHPMFNSENTRFEIILVGRKISEKDYEITNRLESLADKNDPGLIGTGKIKRYVKTWQTIIDEFKISSSYLLTHLKAQRDNLENETAASLTLSLQQKTA